MRVEGNLAYLPPTQLERKLYVEVNAALESLGGSWNRKAKAHVFPDDPQAAIEQVTLDGCWSDAKRDFECFYTPLEVGEQLADTAEIYAGDLILEPSAGSGSLLSAIFKYQPKVEIHACEIRSDSAAKLQEKFPNVRVECKDFMQVSAMPKYDRVLMNPPFSKRQDVLHVRHAHRFLKQGGKLVSVMSAGVRFRSDKMGVSFRDFVDEHGGRFEDLEEGSFKSSGTSVRTVICKIPA
jgi:predicted RNA methylase